MPIRRWGPTRRCRPIRRSLALATSAWAVAALAVLAGACASNGDNLTAPRSTATPTTAVADDRPNVMLVLTDDQTLESLRSMPETLARFGTPGTTFAQHIVGFPLCCPSRATLLTGRHATNHGVIGNVPPAGGATAFDDAESLPVWLQRAGYTTGHVGKWLNGWGLVGKIEPQPGWDEWFALIDPTTTSYFRFDVSVDGTRTAFGDDEPAYVTDVLGERAEQFVRVHGDDSAPWFLQLAFTAPHVGHPVTPDGPDGALPDEASYQGSTPHPHPDDLGAFDGEPIHHGPAFGEADLSDKPETMRVRTRTITPLRAAAIDRYARRELESLRSVDRWMARLDEALRATGQRDRTIVIFTSDNGLFHGEHGLVLGKVQLYEEAIRVPLLVRGPGFPAGASVASPTSNTDIAATIVALSGATASTPLDGTSLLAFVDEAARGAARTPPHLLDRAIALENAAPELQLRSHGVRTQDWAYWVTQADEEELYDLRRDPAQLDNVAADPAYASVRSQLAEATQRLATCAGAKCVFELDIQGAPGG